MLKAIQLARKGIGSTSPNPRVGAVVVKGGRKAGEGFHARAGGDHAEIIALKQAGRRARGATLYVTLEPCAHFGKTPPCVLAVLRSGVSRVVIAERDPNPVTKGRGVLALKRKGLRVTEGVLRAEAEELNRPFRKWVTTGLPYVTLKAAQSLDGKIASRGRDSKWITSEASRRVGQFLRKASDAVLVGIETVLADNPRLDVRVPVSKRPVKVVLDSRLRIPADARLFRTPGRVLVATTSRSEPRKRRVLANFCDVATVPSYGGRVDLKALLKELGRRGVLHVLVEGGGEVIGDFVDRRLADEIFLFVAPVIIGGRAAPASVMGKGPASLNGALKLKDVSFGRVGPDFIFYGKFTV